MQDSRQAGVLFFLRALEEVTYLLGEALESSGIIWLGRQLTERGGLRGSCDGETAARRAPRHARLVCRAPREVLAAGRQRAQVATQRRRPTTSAHFHVAVQTQPESCKHTTLYRARSTPQFRT